MLTTTSRLIDDKSQLKYVQHIRIGVVPVSGFVTINVRSYRHRTGKLIAAHRNERRIREFQRTISMFLHSAPIHVLPLERSEPEPTSAKASAIDGQMDSKNISCQNG
jgi:hypothetical protein